MTYCLSLLCRDGIVFLSDSRTSAGMDNITIHSKMRVYSQPGDRVICVLTSGNLSLTQSVLALIEEDFLKGKEDNDTPHLLNQSTPFETARYVGGKVREVDRMERHPLEKDGFRFDVNLIVGGQIGSLPHECFQVYPQGNVLHASVDSPFLQIGESKYGKPILDRGFRYETNLSEALKFGILSMDATMKSNVSVGPPIDIFLYEKDSIEARYHLRMDENDPYLDRVRQLWDEGIVRLVTEMPAFEFPARDRLPVKQNGEVGLPHR